MSVHDHHNDPNDPINQPPKRSKSALDPVDRSAIGKGGMGGAAWMIGFLALVLIGGIIYVMTDRTTTASNTTPPPAASTSATPSTTGSGSNPASNSATTTGAGSPSSTPTAPSPNR